MDSLGLGAWVAGCDRELTCLNWTFRQLVGAEATLSQPIRWSNLVSEEQIEQFQRAWPSGDCDAPFEVQVRAAWIPKGERWISVRGVREGASGWFGTCVVVAGPSDSETDSRQLQALRESEQLFRTQFDLSAIGQIQSDVATGKFLRINDKMCEILGYSREELMGMTRQELMHPEDRARHQVDFPKLVAGEISEIRRDTRVIRKDGAILTLAVNLTIHRDAAGKPLHTVSLLQDVTDHIAAVSALKESEERYRIAFDQSAVGAYHADAETGRLIRVNARLSELTGFTPEELLEKSYLDLTHPDERLSSEEMRKALFDRRVERCEIERLYIAKDGSELPVQVSAAVMRNAHGAPMHTVAVVHDMRPRLETERALRQSEARYRSYFDASGIGIVHADPATGRYLEANERMCEMLGYPREELLQLSFLDILHEDCREQSWARFGQLVRGEVGRYLAERKCVRKDGSPIWLVIDVTIVRDAFGHPVHASGLHVDISDRISAEEALRGAELGQRVALEAAEAGIWEWKPTTEVVTWSKRARQVLSQSVPARQTLNEMFKEIDPLDLEAVRRGFDRARTGKRPIDVEFRIDSNREEKVWIHLLGRGVDFGLDGSATKVVGIVQNVTDRKLGELALQDMNAELERRVEDRTRELSAAYEELEGFSYSVSHDLRAPLRSIVATSAIVQRDFGDEVSEPIRAQLSRQASAANRMARLIDDLLSFSRLSQSRLDRSEVDLSQMASDVVRDIVSRSIGLHPQFEIDPGLRCVGDRTMLGFVVQNLFENACKFVQAGESPHIHFGRNVEMEHAPFFVRDRGIGFDMRYVDKIFKPFERLVKDSEYPGTGIGLANVKRIVARHGGKIWAESGLGHGTTFYFTLPQP